MVYDERLRLFQPNGRFEVGKKICLSISGHHPESWQPSWSIRTALLAIIGFMPSPEEGTIGSLNYTFDERVRLARKSVRFVCDQCGPTEPLLKSPDQKEGHDTRTEANELIKTMALKARNLYLTATCYLGRVA